jgi:hypothetical protein
LPFHRLQVCPQALLDPAGSIVLRSFWPFPHRTRISCRSKSRSFTRSSRHSCNRNPAP